MKVGAKKERKNHLPLLLIALAILLVSIKLLLPKSVELPSEATESDLYVRTQIHSTKTYLELIDDEKSILASEGNLNIHLVEEFGNLKVVYIYKDKLSERQQYDRFFLHVYLKDRSLIKRKYNWDYGNLNFDFAYFNPIVLKKAGVNYFIYPRELKHGFSKKYVLFDEIEFISTGRNHEKQGRSLSLEKIPILDSIETVVDNKPLKTLDITMSDKAYDKIKKKRREALAKRLLVTSDDDLVNVEIKDEKGSNKAKLRLKGDLMDHLVHKNKWSFRLILDNENTVSGMRKFSLQRPAVRFYLWEWLFQKCIKDNDLMGLRYDFVNLNLRVQGDSGNKTIPMGIMALEESFDKILIENNQRREGVILAFDESLSWEDRGQNMHHKVIDLRTSKERKDFFTQNSPIKVFNKNKVLSDEKLAKQFEIAKDLFDGLRKKKYKVSEVFDLDKLTTFVAISNLFGNSHGLSLENLRIYYNPITNKLEPIAFDANAGGRLNKIVDYPFSEGDAEYKKMVLKKLSLICNQKFVNELLYKYEVELESLFYTLQKELDFKFEPASLAYNSNFIKKAINPANPIISGMVNKTDNSLVLEVNNLSELPINLTAIQHSDGRKLDQKIHNSSLLPKQKSIVEISLNPYFTNAFVSKKNKKGEFQFPKDLEDLRLVYEVAGVELERKCSILPYAANQSLDESVAKYKGMFQPNMDAFGFLERDSNVVYIKKGNHLIDQTIIIPKGLKLIIEKGVNIELKNGASLISYSSVDFTGSEKEPIKFYSSDSSGGGLFITNAINRSKLNYCEFENLSQPELNGWNLSGAINFHESDVDIANSSFSYNRCEDYLNVIRSEFTLSHSTFENTKSDAFDGDFVKGTISDSQFINAGNDGIDVSGSEITLKDILVKQPSDKAISGGEASTIVGQNIKIEGGEIGVVSKDLSTIELKDIEIIDTRLALSSFQKKTEYGKGEIKIDNIQFTNNELNYLIENGSILTLNDTLVETVSDNVIDQMYGNEYGKSSKP